MGHLKLGSLAIVAAMLLSTAAFAEEGEDGISVPQTHHVLNDADPSATYDLPVSDDPVAEPDGGGQGIAVGEPDPNGGGDDPMVDPGTDDGTDVAIDDATEGDTEGEVTIYTMDGGPCIDCNVIPGGVVPQVQISSVHQTVERSQKSPKRHTSAVAMSAANMMAQCLAQHTRSAWICQWQNGAGE